MPIEQSLNSILLSVLSPIIESAEKMNLLRRANSSSDLWHSAMRPVESSRAMSQQLFDSMFGGRFDAFYPRDPTSDWGHRGERNYQKSLEDALISYIQSKAKVGNAPPFHQVWRELQDYNLVPKYEGQLY